jgi:hypothetical protein
LLILSRGRTEHLQHDLEELQFHAFRRSDPDRSTAALE